MSDSSPVSSPPKCPCIILLATAQNIAGLMVHVGTTFLNVATRQRVIRMLQPSRTKWMEALPIAQAFDGVGLKMMSEIEKELN